MYAEQSSSPGTWTQLGSRREINMSSGDQTPGVVAANTGFNTAGTSDPVTGYSLTPADTYMLTANRPFDLTALGELATDESITFHFVISDTRKNNANFYNTMDNLQIDGVASIPEPSTLAFSLLAISAFLGLWRKMRV